MRTASASLDRVHICEQLSYQLEWMRSDIMMFLHIVMLFGIVKKCSYQNYVQPAA